MGTFTLGDAARILRVSPRRLRYWERTALVRLRDDLGAAAEAEPAARDAGFDFKDLVGARAILALLEQGVPLRRIRRTVERLRREVPELGDPLGSLRLWGEGAARVVVDHDGILLEPDGQTLFDFRTPAGGSPVVDMESARSENEVLPSAMDWFERGCELDAETTTHPQAEAAYRHAIERDPLFADAHCNLGAVLYNQGQKSASRHCFERCLEIESRHVEAHFNLANILEEEGLRELALRHYLEALEADPLYADIHVNVALLCEQLKMVGRAREHWRRYLQLLPAGSWAEVARQRLAATAHRPGEGS